MSQAVEFINSFSHTGSRITDLSRISGLLERLDNPHNGQKFVHIAGTNGKGSTLEYMSEILISAGYKTGQFTSPFIEVYHDRIRINGENIPDSRLNEICGRVRAAVSGENYSQFEISLAIAFIYFKEENCDIVFLETGIGGILDATNIIENPLVSVITSVSLDHTELLGNTVSEIAQQKAGIIKKNCPVLLSADNTSDTISIVKDKAKECGSEFNIPVMNMCVTLSSDIFGSRFSYKADEYYVSMCGHHQVCNAVTAIEAARILRKSGYDISCENIRNGLAKAKVKLRIEVLSENPPVIADGGHNASGIDSLISIVEKINRPIIGVCGMMKGKDIEYGTKRLSEILATAICTDGYIEGCMPADKLSEYFTCKSETAPLEAAIDKALSYAKEKNGLVLICGSLYLASAARAVYVSSDK
ncbi:MAG: bifunctional folylpolyglutamate synthase/dihydrofolate synthase [Oscillospiraceae bacterium]|nr:bifunctional folylpolyglutamate synthase/dihydrofolate synthase [Oscillospiraceae bacterium]